MDAGTITLNIAPEWFWGIVAVVGLGLASALICWITGPAKPRKPLALLPTIITAAKVLAPIWLMIFGAILYGLWLVIYSFRGELDTDNLRWHVLAFVGLITALGGIVGAPLALIRVFTTERQTRATEEGLLTDRINTAVLGLGSEKTVKIPQYKEDDHVGYVEQTQPNIEVRLGAILALERLAKNNLNVHIQIMEILTAYIRENAKASEAAPLPECPRYSAETAESYEKALEDWKTKHKESLKDIKPRADIQMALSVIGRRAQPQKQLERGTVPAFADLAIVQPQWSDFKTEPKKFREAQDKYQESIRNWRNQPRIYILDLRGTNLRGADFGQGDFQTSNFTNAKLQGAILGPAQLQGAFLRAAQLQGAFLRAAQLQGAHLWEAQLQGASLWEAQLQGADLRTAQLQGAYLRTAQFSDRTDLTVATLRGAAVRSVDFTNIPQITDHIPDIFGDASITLPGGIRADSPDWPDHWSKETLEFESRDGEFIDDFQDAWDHWRTTLSPPAEK